MPYRRSCAACALGSRAAAFRLFCRNRQRCGIPAARAAGFRRDERRTKGAQQRPWCNRDPEIPWPAAIFFPLFCLAIGMVTARMKPLCCTRWCLCGHVYLAILEPTEENGWRVTQTAEGLSSEVESVNTAHLRDENSLQILVGYASAQGDRYMVVYLYTEDGLQIIIKQAYTEMILANLTAERAPRIWYWPCLLSRRAAA